MSLGLCRLQRERDGGSIRLETENIGDSVGLVPCWCRDLADRVDKVDGCHPLVDGELSLAGEVM